MSFAERIRQQRNLNMLSRVARDLMKKKNQVKWKQKVKGTANKSKIKLLFIIY